MFYEIIGFETSILGLYSPKKVLLKWLHPCSVASNCLENRTSTMAQVTSGSTSDDFLFYPRMFTVCNFILGQGAIFTFIRGHSVRMELSHVV
jgi:hypothetical protein